MYSGCPKTERKPNQIWFGYRDFRISDVRVVRFVFFRSVVSLDRSINKGGHTKIFCYIKWSSLVKMLKSKRSVYIQCTNLTSEIRTIQQLNHFLKCRNPNVRISDIYYMRPLLKCQNIQLLMNSMSTPLINSVLQKNMSCKLQELSKK